MDINKVWISGIAKSKPVLTKLPSQTNICSFTMCVTEEFYDKHNNKKERPSHIVVEALGKNAQAAVDKVEIGKRFQVEGYLREENSGGISSLRIRAFVINDDHQDNKASMLKAIDIVSNSQNLEDAVEKLKEALHKD